MKDRYAKLLEERRLVLDDVFTRARRRSRRTRTTPGPRPVSPATAKETLVRFETVFRDVGVDWRGTVIHGDLEDLRWLAGSSSLDEATSDERFRSAIVRQVRYDRVGKAMRRARTFQRFDLVMKKLRRMALEGDRSAATQGWDHLFEIELAAQLVDPRWTVRFGTTDVVLVDAFGDEFGFECKRPRKSDTLIRNVREACRQLEERQERGVVAVSLDLVLDSPWIVARDVRNVPALCERAIELYIRPVEESVRSELAHSVDKGLSSIYGVLFCGSFLIGAGHSERYFVANTRFHSRPLASPSLPGAEAVLETFRPVLTIGQEELRSSP